MSYPRPFTEENAAYVYSKLQPMACWISQARLGQACRKLTPIDRAFAIHHLVVKGEILHRITAGRGCWGNAYVCADAVVPLAPLAVTIHRILSQSAETAPLAAITGETLRGQTKCQRSKIVAVCGELTDDGLIEAVYSGKPYPHVIGYRITAPHPVSIT